MATVQELERAFLNAHNAGDKQAAQALADALRQAMVSQPAPQAPAAPKERTTGEFFKDIGAGAVSGVGALAQLPGQLYGLATGDFSDTGLTKVGRELRETGEGMKSEELKRLEAERAAKIKEATKEGELSAGLTAAKETLRNPALLTNFIAEQVPNLIPGLAVARGLSLAGAGARTAVAGAVGTGATQQGADVGAETFKELHKKLVDQGMSPEEATGSVLGYARYAGLGAAAISVGAQILPGGRAIERALANVPIKGGIAARGKAIVKGGLGETVSEMIEEGGGKVAQNLAIQQVDPSRSLTEGLGETMGMAAVGGLGLGTAAGVVSRREAPEAKPEPAAEPAAGVAPPVEPGGAATLPPTERAAPAPAGAPPEAVVSEDELRARAEAPPITEAEFAQGEPSPRPPELAEMEQDMEALGKEVKRLERGEPGKSLWSAIKGNLIPSDFSELDDKKFRMLLAPKGARGTSIADLTASGQLNDWLPEQYHGSPDQLEFGRLEGDELAKAKDAEEYIKDQLRQGNYLTYATNMRLQQIGVELSNIEDAYKEYADAETFNTLVQEAVDEQRGLYESVAGAPTETEAGAVEPPARVLEQIPEQPIDEYYPDQSEVVRPPPQTVEEVRDDERDKKQAESAKAPDALAELVALHMFGKAVGGKPSFTRVPGGVSAELSFEPNKALADAVANNDPVGVITQLEESKNPFIQRIADLAKEARPFGVGLFPPEATRSDRKYSGIYIPSQRNIYMRSKATAAVEHVVAHELTHHLTMDGLRNPTEAQKPAVKKINDLYKHVKSYLSSRGKGKLYALKNVEEFVAESNSNVNFQYELAKIPYQKQTAWSAFTKYVAELLGFKNNNALTEIIALTDELVSRPSQQASFAKDEVVGIEDKKQEPFEDAPADASEEPKRMQDKLEEKWDKMRTGAPKEKPSSFEGVPDDLWNKISPTFFPQNKNIVQKIDGMRDRFWQRLAQGIADQYRTIKDYSEEAYMKARMAKTIDGALEGILFDGEVKLNNGALDIKPNSKGLLKVLEPVGNEVDRYQIWAALNRDAELVAKGKAPSVNKEIVARRDELSDGKIGNQSRLEVYKKVQRDMKKLNGSVLTIALRQGIIDKEAYKTFRRDINYIPFYKVMEEGGDVQAAATKSGLVNQYFSKALKGGEKPFGDLMENTLRNWSHILSASMKNEAANATIRAAIKLNGAFPNLKVGLRWEDGKVYSDKTGAMVGDGSLKPEYTSSDGKGLIKTMIGGKPAYFEVIEPLLLESIMSIGYMGPKSKFLDIARDFKNMLQFGVTLSPAFKIRNLFRDSISAIAVSDLKRNPFANVAQGWAASDRNNPAHISALAGGAIFNFGSAYEGDQAKLIRRLLNQGVKGDTILDNEKKIESGLRAAWRAYQDLGNKSEAANRMALYQQLRNTVNPKTEQNFTHLEASFYARDLLDFSMQGSWPAFRLLTQTIPFLNARVQGLYKLGRDGIVPTSRVIYNKATGKPIEATDKQKAEQFSIVMSAVALASLMLYMAFKDDEEFQKREQWDRDNFWWFKLPGMDNALRIPKPFEIGAFGTMVERVAEQIVDKGAEGKVFEQSLKRMLTDTFAINPIPQVIKPLVDLYANKDSFTGAPIETAGMERLSKAERIAEKTSPLAIALSKVTNVFLPESTEISPVQADYAIKGYLGWLGGTASWASHYAVQPFSKSAYPDNNWTETLSAGFIKSLPATQSRYVTAFYENNKEIAQAYADMRHFAQLGEADKVQDILKDKGDKIAMAKFYDNAAKDMAEMRKAILAIRNDENMSGAQKKEEIDRMKVIIGEIARQMEEARLEVKKQFAGAR
jgi:hypothetical protein